MGSRFRDRRFVTFAAAWALVAVTGSAQSQQFQVNSRSNGAQLSPAVAFEPGGGFVVVYEDVTTADPADHSIWRRRFDATGAPLGDDQYLGCPRACVWPVLAIDGAGAALVLGGRPGLAARPAGGFIRVTYELPERDLYAQRLDAGGAVQGPRIPVNTRPTHLEFVSPLPSVAVGADNGFLVAWIENDAGDTTIQVRGFDAQGVARGPQFRVDPGSSEVQDVYAPDVAALPNGRYVVVWDGAAASVLRDAPQGAVVDETGEPVGEAFPLTDQLSVKMPRVASLPDPAGGFAVVYGRGWPQTELYLQRFDGTGQVVGGEGQVNQPGYPSDFLTYFNSPAVAAAADGTLIVVWPSIASVGNDVSVSSVQGRLFPAPDSDSDGVSDTDDNCPSLANPDQADADGDGVGNVCDPYGPPDSDGDGTLDLEDQCPLLPNQEDAYTACLLGGKFEVAGEMRDFADPPNTSPAKVMTFPSGRAETEQAVFYDAFQPGHFEIGIKMIDACSAYPEGHPLRHYWLFAGGLTNARAEITITDTVTDETYTWANPAGTFPLSLGDTQAFACVDGSPSCSADGNTACLLGDRFRVAGSMWDFADPPLETAPTVMSFPALRAQSDGAVFFESFNAGNFEVGVKMVDACDGFPPGHPLHAYWVFYGGLTNAYTRIRVRQIATGLTDVWTSLPGSLPRSVGRTQAFPCE